MYIVDYLLSKQFYLSKRYFHFGGKVRGQTYIGSNVFIIDFLSCFWRATSCNGHSWVLDFVNRFHQRYRYGKDTLYFVITFVLGFLFSQEETVLSIILHVHKLIQIFLGSAKLLLFTKKQKGFPENSDKDQTKSCCDDKY